MTFLSKDHNLSLFILFGDELLFYAFLQPKDDGTGSIDQFDVVLFRYLVGAWGFSVGTKQYTDILELLKLFVIDGDQAHLGKTFHLHIIVNNIAQTV